MGSGQPLGWAGEEEEVTQEEMQFFENMFRSLETDILDSLDNLADDLGLEMKHHLDAVNSPAWISTRVQQVGPYRWVGQRRRSRDRQDDRMDRESRCVASRRVLRRQGELEERVRKLESAK